MRKNKKTTDLS